MTTTLATKFIQMTTMATANGSTTLNSYNDSSSYALDFDSSTDSDYSFANDSNHRDWEDFISNVRIVVSVVWPLIEIVGVLANAAVLIVMLCASRLTSATQYFIVNLALSDLLFLVICPTLALMNYHQLIIYEKLPQLVGDILCKLDYYSTHVTVFITCLTLMSMTFDRYLVIMHPLKALTYRTKTKAILINLSIWLLSLLLSVPHGYYRKFEAGMCMNSKSLEELIVDVPFLHLSLDRLIYLYTVTIAYIIPLVSIVVCYLIMMNKLRKEKPEFNESISRHAVEKQKRRRVLVMIALVTLLFAFSWLPIHSIYFALKFFPQSFPLWNKYLFVIKTIAHTLTYINSMLNPFFYTIMGNNFRKQIVAQRAKYSTRLKSYYSRGSNSVQLNENTMAAASRHGGCGMSRNHIDLNNSIVALNDQLYETKKPLIVRNGANGAVKTTILLAKTSDLLS